jgi:hypothetical protein
MITPVKQQLAAVRMLFDWLITGQIMPVNPASAIRGPKHVVKTGKTPVLEGQEWRKLIDAIPDRHGAGPTRPGADRHPHAAGIGADKKGFLFRTSRGHGGTALADQPMTQVDAWRMVRNARSPSASWRRSASLIPGNRDHGVPCQWWRAGACAGHGRARESPHHQALRQDEGTAYPR